MHSDPLLLVGAILAAGALLVVALGAGNGGAGRVELAQAAPPPADPPAATDPADRPGAPAASRERPPAAAQPDPPPDTEVLTVRPGASVGLYAAPGGDLVETLGDTTEFDSPTVLSVAARRGSWAGVSTQLLPNGELGWVKIDDAKLARGDVGQAIVIDLSQMRGRLYRNGEIERRWTVGIGGSQTPTPTGRFSITDEIEGGLNPVYGCCAIALSATQPNLPAGWTGGDRIAIHGTSEPLGEANSTGCIHSGDADLRALIEQVPLGTPVTIRR